MKALKKLLAAAIASTLPLAAMAQATAPAAPPAPAPAAAPAAKPAVSATIYGTLNVNAHLTQAKDATVPAADVSLRESVSIDSSNIGFRGSVEANSLIGATFQCETGANVDGIGNVGLCNRNSRVGITGAKWGTLWYGNWDTPMKAGAYGTKADDPFGNTDVFGFNAILSSPGFNARTAAWKSTTGGNVGSFDLRANNSIGYHSPKFGGLSFKLQYSVNELKQDDNAAATPTPLVELNPRLYGAVVNYDLGGLSVFASYEKHDDAFGLNFINGTATNLAFGATAVNPATQPSSDWAWRAGAGYELAVGAAALTLSAWVEQLTYEQDGTTAAGSIDKFDRLAYQVGAKFRTGNHELRARWNMAAEGDCELVGGGACSTDNYGASMYALGYAYHMTKTVQTYLYYSQIMNDDAAQYTFTTGGATPPAGNTPRGADPLAVGVGIRYAF